MSALLPALPILIALLALELARQYRRLVVVTTRQGESYRGTRRLTIRPVVRLEDAEFLGPGQPLSGRLLIPFDNVAAIQEPAEQAPQAETAQ